VVAVVAVAVGLGGCGGDETAPRSAEASSTPAAARGAASRTFRSEVLPYSVVLPRGWEVDPASQVPRSETEEFRNADRTRALVVGHGFPEDGETLADRVEANRQGEVDAGCMSDRRRDRSIRVSGKRAVLWSYTCSPDPGQIIEPPNTYALSAQTLRRRRGHRRVGYRFTVVVEKSRRADARPLLDMFLRHLRFLDDSPVTGDR